MHKMDRLFLSLSLFVLCLASILSSIAIAISPETVINDCDNDDTKYKRRISGRPHIVIIVADDMGWNDVSFHGSDQIPTPNIDALAYNGVILNSHYVSAMCTPSRSALMTGKNPIHLGMQHYVLRGSEPRGLPLNEKLMPEYLKEAGYRTHIVGKWHLGFYKREYTPTYRGFDTHFGYWNGLKDYYNHMSIEKVDDGTEFQGFDMRRNLSVAWDTIGKYSTDLFTEEAVQLIHAHNTTDPMFLYLAHLAPHSGNENDLLQAPAEEIAKFSYIKNPKRRIYAAMVSKLDQSVGDVIEALRNREMLERSIILFISDNGAPTEGYLQNHGSNYPFRGIKNSPWEGGVRGAAAIWSPLIKQRKVSNQLIFVADWLPTLLSAAGIQKTNISDIDGYDMWPTLVSGGASRRHEVLINIDDIYNYSAIRIGNFKYVKGETTANFTWVGESGKSDDGQPSYDPEKVLNSKVGVAIASIKQIENNQLYSTVENSEDNILTPQKILQLRDQAQIHCNVTEMEKISCNPLISPCLFNIQNDPCEMINIIHREPTIAMRLKLALAEYRLNMVPPSNKNLDPCANPKFWNNTWTCWAD